MRILAKDTNRVNIRIRQKRKQVSRLFVLLLYIFSVAAPNVFMVEQVSAVPPTLDQSGFRFLSNVDEIQSQYITVDHSATDDHVGGSAIDTINGHIFVGGYNNEWIIEKREVADGSLVSGFGTNGRINQDIPGSGSEGISAIELDLNDGSFFVVGWDRVSGVNDARWRIEKRDLIDGSLMTGFGTGGVITSDPTTGDDIPRAIIIDKTNERMIAAGYESSNGGSWRIEKRSTVDGALDTGFATGGVFTFSTSGRFETVQALAIDAGAGFYYLAGGIESTGNVGWRIEKRRVDSNVLCTAADCGTEFGTGGVFSHNPSSGTDSATTIKVDIAGDALYFGGTDGNNGGQWRVLKVTAASGALINDFGTDGVVTSNPGTGNNEISAVELDGVGGFIYFIGTETTSGDVGWRVDKRTRANGGVVTSWGDNGQVTINPSTNTDPPNNVMIDVDRGLLYAVGGDRTLGASDMRWRYEQFLLDTGGRWLGDQNGSTVSSTKVTFRIRVLLTVGTDALLATTSPNLKLQHAYKEGTCDTAFVGEEWNDVTTTDGEVRYHDNPTLTDASAAVAVTGDPTAGSATVLQTYEESNTFVASNDTAVGEAAMWDLSLKDFDAFGAYCFRVVYDDGTLLDSYSFIPEISFCKDDPRAENVMRHGTYFCEGTKRSFFWAKDTI